MGRAHWWDPEMRTRWDATHSSAAGGVRATISAWTAEERSRVSGRELTDVGGGEELHGGPASAAKKRYVGDWEKLKVIQAAHATSFADARRVITRKMVDGMKNEKARFVARGHPGLT